MKRNALIGLAIGCLALVAAFVVFDGTSRSDLGVTEVTLDGGAAMAAEHGELMPDMVLGEEDAPIEIIEYASFTCPHCARFHMDVYPKLKTNFVEPGHAKFIFREVYFDKYGLWAGMLARCGGPDRYFGLVDMILTKQGEWAQGSQEDIVGGLYAIGRVAGLTDEEMQACLQDNDNARALVADYQAKAGADGINSTPSFVIDGENFSNMSYEDFETLLNGKLN